MTPTEQQLYRHLKEQIVLLDRQLNELQELRERTEQDLLRMEEQQKERNQLDLFK